MAKQSKTGSKKVAPTKVTHSKAGKKPAKKKTPREKLSAEGKRLLKNIRERIRYHEKDLQKKVRESLKKKLQSKNLTEERLKKYTEDFEKYLDYYLVDEETGEAKKTTKEKFRKAKREAKKKFQENGIPDYPNENDIIFDNLARVALKAVLESSNKEVTQRLPPRIREKREFWMEKIREMLAEAIRENGEDELARKIKDRAGEIIQALDVICYATYKPADGIGEGQAQAESAYFKIYDIFVDIANSTD